MKARVAVGLVHYPVYDKSGAVVCTNVTNLDVHDIARACRTYGVEKYYVINPMKEQVMFVSRLLDFWRTGTGSSYNPMRKTALTMVQMAHSVDEAVRDWSAEPILITTSARDRAGAEPVSFQDLRAELHDSEKSYLLLFGTGFGLEESVFKNTRLLEPIRGASKEDYRHLSVRSAVSICLDRLLGAW
jgi:hypothetical protein